MSYKNPKNSSGNLPPSEIVIISSLSASLLNLTVSNDPITACCIEIIVKNKANGIIFILFGECFVN